MALKDVLQSLNPFAQTKKTAQPTAVEKAAKYMQALANERPTSLEAGPGGVPYKGKRFPPNTLYAIKRESDVLAIVHNALRGEIFRNGFEVLPEWKADPETSVYDPKDIEQVNDEDLEKERRMILRKCKNVNSNAQTLIDVFKELEDDINTVDDAYLMFLFNYTYTQGGDFADKELEEAIRADPKVIEIVANQQEIPGMDDQGYVLLSCPSDRTNIVSRVRDYDPDDPPKHPLTGHHLYPVYYKHNGIGSEETYYFEWEVVHKSRYFPSKTYGYSPILSVWRKVWMLVYQDDYMKDLYEGRRPPKGLLVAKTGNKDSLKAAWDELLERAKTNPHMIQLLGIQGSRTSGGEGGRFAEFFDFMRPLDEMQFTEVRNEARNQIGALYGVTPLFQNDVSTSGGLNNEGRQITVTNRSVELKQQDYNDTFFPAFLKALGAEYHVMRLNPSEEQDDMAQLERQEKALQIGREAVALGLEAEYDSDKQKVVIKDGPLEQQEQPGFGDQGGFGGGGDEDDDREGPGDTPSGAPQTGADILDRDGPAPLGGGDTKKASLPAGAHRISDRSEAPEGAKIGRGPQGGLYYIPSGQDGAEDDSASDTPSDGSEPPLSDEDPASDIDIYEGRDVDESGEEYANGQKPLTAEALEKLADEFNKRVPDEIMSVIQESIDAYDNGTDTQGTHKNGDSYSEERLTLHQEAKERYDRSADAADHNGKAVFMAGVPGAGKSYAVSNLEGSEFFQEVDEGEHEGRLMEHTPTGERYLVINSDDFKQMLPEYNGGLGAALVHNESSDLKDQAIERYRNGKVNIIVDGTFSDPDDDSQAVDQFRESGYEEISMVHVDTPAHLAMKRAWERFSRISSEDEDFSGRYAPFPIIAGKRDGVRESGKTLRDQFDSYTRVDNSLFGQPQVVEQEGNQLVKNINEESSQRGDGDE